MTDSWEDWENEDYEVPVLQTVEQLKRLEEQKLVEESDNALARDLFGNKEEEDLVYDELKCLDHTFKNANNTQKVQLPTKKYKPEKTLNKQKENEQKQKEISKKIKEEKAKREKEKELFGDVNYDDEYAEYEDKFY
jgi:hypothetical protein